MLLMGLYFKSLSLNIMLNVREHFMNFLLGSFTFI